jgi:hypothetical protein
MIRLKSLIASEADVQSLIVGYLRVHGWSVAITSRRIKRCQHCGKYPGSNTGDGVTKGKVGDLLVRWPAWAPGVAVALEVKKPGKVRYSSPEQQAAALAGEIVVVQSPEEALSVLERAREALRAG